MSDSESEKLKLFGFFHFFYTLPEFLQAVKFTIASYDVATGKYIILKDQISTKDGLLLGKKKGITFCFTSVFSDKETYERILKEGVIDKDNFISSKDISRDEFDEKNNLKKGITLLSYKDLMNYIRENDLK